MQYVDERPVNELTLKIYPGNGEWTLYEDDGHSFAYRNGTWTTTTYQTHQEGQQIILEVTARQGNWTPPEREVIAELAETGESFTLVNRLS
ncbi:DUF5110 domain-containing protein [Kovacikia minuta CCNUW1]|nr:DUF5110 domain-containing protein [Kovacikia minuta CCNUW1]